MSKKNDELTGQTPVEQTQEDAGAVKVQTKNDTALSELKTNGSVTLSAKSYDELAALTSGLLDAAAADGLALISDPVYEDLDAGTKKINIQLKNRSL